MPSRFLREAYITSERINAVSPEARDLWVRLLLQVDDFGRFYGDPRIVASKCFPLSAHARRCAQLLAELAAQKLVLLYNAEGKQYLALTQWSERVRSRPKFPDPPDLTADCGQLSADREQVRTIASNCAPPTPSPSPSPTPSPTPSAASGISLAADGWDGISADDVAAWTSAYPALDLPTELAKARAWAMANPKNRKSNWRRFLVGWLSRSQDRARPLGHGTPASAPSRRVAL